MNLGTQFKSVFEQAINVQDVSGLLLEFNTYRTDSRYKSFAFVEAKGDADFYSTTTVDELKSESCRFITSGRNEDDVMTGKKAVLRALVDIDNDLSLKKSMSKCIFIVDQDYDPKLKHSEIVLTDKQKKHVSITKGYSFENYYFQKENISLLVRELELDSSAKRNIKRELVDFICQRKEYFAAKGVISLYYSHLPYVPRMHKHKDIFSYDFRHDIVDEERYKETLENMLRVINTDLLLKGKYEKLIHRISNNPLLYARGHDIYDFFVGYIRYNGDDLSKRDWSRINKQLIVEFLST